MISELDTRAILLYFKKYMQTKLLTYGRYVMKRILVFLSLSLALFIAAANAEDKSNEDYVIQKGDTLWDISDTRLEDTFLWPKLWNVNPQIENPDLIYPGSKIRIPSREELMKMEPVPMKKIRTVKKPKRKKTKARHTYEVPELPKFKYVVDEKTFIASGWISEDLPSIGRIMSPADERSLLGRDDVVYLEMYDKGVASVSDKGTEPNKYYTVRDIKEVRHPITNKPLGHQLRITGMIEVTGEDNNIPKALILDSYENVMIGDELWPYRKMEPPLVRDVNRRPAIEGYVVESHMNTGLLGEGNIIFLDKGQSDGIDTGDVFSIYDKPPTERIIGSLQVISHEPKTSAAVILSSEQEVLIGTKWGNRK